MPTKPTSEPKAPGEAVPADLESRFKQLTRSWRRETSHLSLAGRMAAHPAYRQIVALG